MATTDYPVAHPLAVKLWSKKLYHDVIGESFLGRFMGEGSDSLIQIKTETSKGPGDRIRLPLRALLTGDGVQGDATLEGNEEALATYYDDILIDQLRHAVRSGGKMSEQRVPFSVREEARMGLTDWWTERMEVAMANQLTGNTGQTDVKYTGLNATVAPTATHRIVCGGGKTLEASLSSSTDHAIQLTDLDRAVTIAKTAVSGSRERIRPVKVDGKKYYVAFLHPYQILRLRADASTAGNFFDINKAILQGGKVSDNPIISRASFIYGQCIVHEWSYLPVLPTNPTTTGAVVTNFRRGVLCGAQAAAMAVGQDGTPNKMSWAEELFDYKNQLGVKAGMIYGIKKTVFNSTDFATIVLSGYAPAP